MQSKPQIIRCLAHLHTAVTVLAEQMYETNPGLDPSPIWSALDAAEKSMVDLPAHADVVMTGPPSSLDRPAGLGAK